MSKLNKLRVFEAFAGYGSQSLALRNIGVDYEVVGICEIDKYALQGYYSLHDENIINFGDISQIDVKDIPPHDLFTYSFPCQDISTAGKTLGMVAGQTRSGLLYECEKIIEHCKPKYLLLENVKNLVGKKFKADFDKWLKYLEGLGYTNYWKVLNAKDFGVPQNRERVFCVSILGEHENYEFPQGFPLEVAVTDILEDTVDEKFYVSQEVQEKLLATYRKNTTKSDCLNIGNKEPKIVFERRCDEGMRFFKNNCVGTIRTIDSGGDKRVLEGGCRVRKLTPKECLRLMGLNDSDIDKIQSTGVSNAQQYKMAGNSIVIQVLEGIFKNLLL